MLFRSPAAAAAGSLEDQAARLQASIAHFRLAHAESFGGFQGSAGRSEAFAQLEAPVAEAADEDHDVEPAPAPAARPAPAPRAAASRPAAATAGADNGDWSAF